jgi:hypothetical protein
MITNIIRIPERSSSNYFDNYWKIYEESYKDENKLNDFLKSNIFSGKMSEDDVSQDIEKIYDIRYNFYKNNYDYVLSYLILSYYTKFFEKNENILKEAITEFFKNGKLSNFIKIYLKSCIDSDISLISRLTYELNEILEKVSTDTELIKFQYYLNKLLSIIDKFDDKNVYLRKNIILHISSKYINKLTNFVNEKGLSYLSNLSKQTIFKNIFANDLLVRYFDGQMVKKFNKMIINKMIHFSEDKLSDSNYAMELFDIINIITTINKISDTTNQINDFNNEDINNFSNYICASLYYLLNEKNFKSVCDIIDFQYNNLSNRLDFLSFYKYHLQWRATNKLNYEYENKAYQHIIKLFVENEYKKIIDNIKNSLDDIFLSELMNKEINDLKITVQSPEFKNVEFDTKKVNVFITSNVIWQDIKGSNNFTNVKKSKEVELYSKLVSNYFDKKYTKNDQKRLLEISNDESFVDISLGNSDIRLPLTYLSVLEMVGNNPNSELENISRNVNLDVDKVTEITAELKVNNIIIENNSKFKFNDGFLTANVVINMMQNKNSKAIDIISEEISYDKDMLIDSVITKVCKTKYVGSENKDCAYVSYGRLIMVVRGELQRFFIPDEKNIRERLARLVTLGYLTEDKECNRFRYIP